jgi:hypothetical protein
MTTVDRREWTLHWLRSLTRRDETRRVSVYTRRRRAWLWRPLLAVGAVLVVTQITADNPVYLLVWVGIGLCLPWVVDC